MKEVQGFKCLALMVVSGLMSACSTFGDQAPQAVIQIYANPIGKEVSISSIDGRLVKNNQLMKVDAGLHIIKISVRERYSDKHCTKKLSYNDFKSDQVYGVFQGDWNGTPTLFLKGSKGEILDSEDVTDCTA